VAVSQLSQACLWRVVVDMDHVAEYRESNAAWVGVLSKHDPAAAASFGVAVMEGVR
jgi:hypothetical protein